MRLQSEEEEDPWISLAPLLDVVFLLLIFFLFAGTLEKPVPQVPVAVPRMNSARPFDAKKSLPRVVAVNAKGDFFVDGRAVNRTELQAVLDLLAPLQSEMRLRLDIDENSRIARLAELLEMLRQRGITNFGLRAQGGSHQ